ncbi:16S rRNA (guanine(527)-N(7))-methyltransferase RsmG [Pararhizobium haloflavum]|uniref:16S rRNA (guanine(527)-N(7))-methyltransferase RsmG n=1 Tax=Pararhizobium haloflavum TaxID=2037914 RepID=UPI001FDF4F9B|nr:16S rRNA (guanine(527)-N(7))-methyltransferase RsmG [Pararhizobium haloflavum]
MSDIGNMLSDVCPVSRETVDRLKIFVDLIEKWSARINLVAGSTRQDMWARHVCDSLQLMALCPEPQPWVDLGSGGGFPGVVTAIALAEHNAGWVHLVESNQKKAAFLRAALHHTGGRGSVHAIRIEASSHVAPEAWSVSARALADLSTLLKLSHPWLSDRHATGWFHKGRDYEKEVAAARGDWRFDLIEHRSKINPESVVLQIRHLERI